MADRLCS